MNTRKIILSLFIFSLAGWGLGFYLLKFYECGSSIFCYNLTTKSLALFYGMPALSFVFFLLLLNQNAFPVWKKFANWYIPIATLIFIFYEGGGFFDPYPEQVFKWVSTLYVAICVILIFFKSLKR
jgi:hypothetical protein